MAHTLGAVYDTPHGVACAMMLPIVMEYNAEVTGDKYKSIAEAILAVSAYADACRPGNPKDTSVEDLKDLFRKIMK